MCSVALHAAVLPRLLEATMTDAVTELKHNPQKRVGLALERDELVFEAKTMGLPVTHIAAAIGLDRIQIHRILRDA
jgi:hypothetical protein